MRYKVVEFITRLDDGGAESLVKTYALMLKDKMDITVLTIRNFTHTATYMAMKENNVKIVSVYPTWNIAVKVFNKLCGWWYMPYKLKKLIKDENPDCIHVHLYLLERVRKIADSIRGIRLLYTCHNVVSHYFGKDYPKQTAAAKYLVKNNDMRFVALHGDMADELNEIFDIDDTVVIRNGIDFERFKEVKKTKTEIRSELGIAEDAYVLGHVGRFTEQKNHEFIVDVFENAQKMNCKAYLLLVGDGELQSQIEQKLSNRGLDGKYMVLSHRTDIPELMKAMDVFLFPSKWEGFGIVAVEAQVSGLRCIESEAVPCETYLSKFAIPLSLSEGAAKWAEVALDKEMFSAYPNTLDKYDMKKEIAKLEALYKGEL